MSNDENTLFAGSSPAMRTNLPRENAEIRSPDKVLTRETVESEEQGTLGRQRKPACRASGQFSRDGSPALQRTRHESQSQEVVRREADQGRERYPLARRLAQGRAWTGNAR
jgi:hypothetical protein